MSEEQWLTGEDPQALLAHLSPGTSRLRKLRLLAAAICCQSGAGLDNERGRKAVEMAERFADGTVRKRTMLAARAAAKGLPRVVGDHLAWKAAQIAVARSQSKSDTVILLRDIFWNPFKPVSVELSWRTPSVLSLAQAAYEERSLPSGALDPNRLGILADALEDAGCTNCDLLTHLRSPGPHVRGCWPLDLLLGRQ